MRQVLLLAAAAAAAAPGTALASDVNLIGEGGIRRSRAPNVATEFLDPAGRTSFHLTPRFTFSDADETFTDSSTWSFEAKAIIRVAEGVAFGAVLPFGLDAPKPGKDQFFIGDFRLGVMGGTVIQLDEGRMGDPAAPRLGLGAGFDLYAPTARAYDAGDCEELGVRAFCNPVQFVRGLRSYEPQLYLERVASARARGHIDFSISILTAELELGLSPGFTVKDEVDFLMLLSWGARLAVRPIDLLEPFIEVTDSVRIAGGSLRGDDLDLPILLTVGLRGHFGIDPALFVSFDLENGGILFGVDLAAAFRTESRTEREIRDPLDF